MIVSAQLTTIDASLSVDFIAGERLELSGDWSWESRVVLFPWPAADSRHLHSVLALKFQILQKNPIRSVNVKILRSQMRQVAENENLEGQLFCLESVQCQHMSYWSVDQVVK